MSGYIINSVDLERPWCRIVDFASSLVEPEGLGTFTRAAGVDGGGFVAKNYPPFEFPIQLILLPYDDDGDEPTTATAREEQFFANRATLIGHVSDPDAPLAVIRVTGPTFHEADCELARPLEFASVGPAAARCVVTLRNLSGLWLPSTGS